MSEPWPDLDAFFEPGRELLVARSTEDALRVIAGLGEEERRARRRTRPEKVRPSAS